MKELIPQSAKNFAHLLNAKYYSSKYGNPSQKLKVIGVTGTDGKTTTSNMLYEILKEAGLKVGLISTINAKIGESTYPLGFHVTTPQPEDLQKFLKQMVDEGLEYVVLETTSHGLEQHRVGGIEYMAAVYTNITHEHLDYHKNWDNYVKAKSKMIDQLNPKGFVVLNRDDESHEKLFNKAKEKGVEIIRYGFQEGTETFGKITNQTTNGISFEVMLRNGECFDIDLPMPGEYNGSNALAAISVAKKLGVSNDSIRKALEEFKVLDGRWDIVQDRPFKVVVDFAHTPNALEKVLTIGRKNADATGKGKVIVVFGCAAFRDETKRPKMGEIAARLADITVLTAEDPRGQSVEGINSQIAEGMRQHNKVKNKDYYSIPDRKEAIRRAIELAEEDDIVIVTGKGHERSMNFDGVEEVEWNDRKIVEEVLKI